MRREEGDVPIRAVAELGASVAHLPFRSVGGLEGLGCTHRRTLELLGNDGTPDEGERGEDGGRAEEGGGESHLVFREDGTIYRGQMTRSE